MECQIQRLGGAINDALCACRHCQLWTLLGLDNDGRSMRGEEPNGRDVLSSNRRPAQTKSFVLSATNVRNTLTGRLMGMDQDQDRVMLQWTLRG